LTHDRPYKKAWSLDRALAEVCSGRGTQFDPDVVDALMDMGELGVPAPGAKPSVVDLRDASPA
jgi:HD-GYP domain-containing protein (c-di-GMP phosphodiesterase class II)